MRNSFSVELRKNKTKTINEFNEILIMKILLMKFNETKHPLSNGYI